MDMVQKLSISAETYDEIYENNDDDLIPIYEEYIGAENSELLDHGYYIDNGYDLVYDFKGEEYGNETLRWWRETDDNWNTMKLYFEDYRYVSGAMILPSCKELTVRIPDTVNGITVTEFYRSGGFKSFDVNPENKYFQSDGKAVFSKDNKKILSYAQYDTSTHYSIPEGTQIVGKSAFSDCDILENVYIPSSVIDIESQAFEYMNSLKILNFESWDKKIKIDKSILGYKNHRQSEIKFTCSTVIDTIVSGNRIKWQSVDGANYYEVYQKLNSGKYKLLKTTKATACKFTTLKSGKSYTFAVKPVAVIPAANYDKEKDEGSYPETFTIEGTMSEDIVVIGK